MKKSFAWMVPEGDIVQGTVTAVHRDPGRLRLVVHFEVEVVEAVQQASDVVSSTRIRGLLQEGDLAMANRLLGRPYSLIGEVVEGDRRGRTIGFPTANQRPDAQLFPAHGVYATRATLDDGSGHDAVTNIGRRPTFGGDAPVAETHLLDFDGDLYGRVLRVELIERLRAEQRFDGVDALIAQIRADADRARERLATLRGAP